MKRKLLKYFEYKGRPISLKKLDDMENHLTEAIEYIEEYYEVIGERSNVLHNLIWPKNDEGEYTEKDDEQEKLHQTELTSIVRNRNRLYYDIKSLKETRGILRRYKLSIYNK